MPVQELLKREAEWERLIDESVTNSFHDSSEADETSTQRRSLLSSLKARAEQTCTSSSVVLSTVLELILKNTFAKKNGDLNVRQAAYVVMFAVWLQTVYIHDREKRPGTFPQHLFLLLGGPGTGKDL